MRCRKGTKNSSYEKAKLQAVNFSLMESRVHDIVIWFIKALISRGDIKMSYEKLLVDNVVCSRRFHLTFDNEAPLVNKVEIKCPHCQHLVFQAENHPQVKLARDENLVRTTTLSRDLIRECDFKDPYPAHALKP